MGWFRNIFKRRPDRFIQLLLQQAEFTVQGMEALRDYLEHPSQERADEVTRIEKEADEAHRPGGHPRPLPHHRRRAGLRLHYGG